MKRITHLLLIVFVLTLPSCLSDDLKKKMNDSMKEMQTNMADQAFRKTLGDIELHKLRFGRYPASLSELKFLNSMDSINFHTVVYHRLDSGYELNLTSKTATIDGQQAEIFVEYPEEFWQGLGCVKSNLRKN